MNESISLVYGGVCWSSKTRRLEFVLAAVFQMDFCVCVLSDEKMIVNA